MAKNNNIIFQTLNDEIKNCRSCEDNLPMGANPIIQIHPDAKILIAGQAPGRIVHETNIPFNDQSGNRLRQWMGIEKNIFYDPTKIAILPMGFCFPGSGKSGDLPPRKECASKWHSQIFSQFNNAELVILIGTYAINYYLKETKKRNLTETVRNFEEYFESHFPIVHPSGLNFRWHAKNKWFKIDVVPVLQLRVKEILNT